MSAFVASITISKPVGPQQKWVDKNGTEIEFPMYVETLKEALDFYNSVYDENQLGELAPTIGMPSNEMLKGVYKLSQAAKEAGTRTKDDLLRKERSCVIL